MNSHKIVALQGALNFVKSQHERVLRLYRFFHEHSKLARRDPERFFKLESTSGSAMADDPPKGWSRRELERWFRGNVDGRETESGNASEVLRVVEHLLEDALEDDRRFGPRKGLPTPKQVKAHEDRSLVGAWLVQIKGEDQQFSYPHILTLTVNKETGRIECYHEGGWEPLKRQDRATVLRSMPVGLDGTPMGWPKRSGKEG